jgi:hypothetical protein
MASTVADNVSRRRAPLSAKLGRKLRCLRARARMMASAYTYERTDPRERFKIALIEKTDSVAGEGVAIAAGAPDPADKSAAFKIDEFDHKGMSCPWCGDRSGMVYHETCDTNFCGGAQTVRADGTQQFRCPICQRQFGLQAADTLHGKSIAAGSGPMRTDNLLSSAAKTLLPRRH